MNWSQKDSLGNSKEIIWVSDLTILAQKCLKIAALIFLLSVPRPLIGPWAQCFNNWIEAPRPRSLNHWIEAPRMQLLSWMIADT